MLRHYRNLLEAVVEDAEQRVSELAVLSGEERRQMIGEWNQTSADYPRQKCMHELIEEQAEATPEAVALAWGEQELSYGELERRANQLARYMQGMGVRPGGLVGICVEHSLDEVVAMLGVLKAGAGYVPLPGDESTVSEPPAFDARSRMPSSPRPAIPGGSCSE